MARASSLALLHAQRLRARWSAFPSESSCLVCLLKLRQAFLVVVCPSNEGCDGLGNSTRDDPASRDGLGHSTRDVPASQAGTPRKGDQPKNWRATDPSISGHQPQNWTGRRYFFNLNVGGHVPGIFFNIDGIHWLSFPVRDVPYKLLEIVVLRWRRLIGWQRFYGLYDSFVFLSSPLRAPLMCSIGCLPFRISLTGRKHQRMKLLSSR